ncbi:M1 family metallopeptidase [Thiohalorhabdus methylotrophus]|uniref:M1 family metallopeptidase n=1 Tax=Thiohalorhabdus methylotrophus TaxID=3242694 RepID=A0ABV4TZI0_9GAMM
MRGSLLPLLLVPLLIVTGMESGAAESDVLPDHHIRVTLDPGASRLQGVDRIRWQGEGPFSFRLHPDLAVRSVQVDGREYPGGRKPGSPRLWTGDRSLKAGDHTADVRFAGTLTGRDTATSRSVLRGFGPRLGGKGVFLGGGSWYPRLGNRLHTYELAVNAPRAIRVAAPGNRETGHVTESRRVTRFRVEHPAEAAVVLGGPYTVQRRSASREIPVATFFHQGLEGLADAYLADSARYMELFEKRYGRYPHAGFAVVSSPWPTGFGYPGIAYLSRRILPLPFIRQQSLPHEVLHNWWGNGVYVAPGSGNWAEGLTTFGADYRLRARSSPEAARRMRLRWLQDFATYNRDGPAPALRDFGARVNEVSRTVGYNKAAFLWIMLRDRLGGESFNAALRRFYREHRYRRASWGDLQQAFEGASGRELGRFFQAWLDRPGAPSLRIAAVRSDGDQVRLTLAQEVPPYPLHLPVHLQHADGSVRKVTALLNERRQTFRWPVPEKRVTGVAVDPDYRVFRSLAPAEVPPRLSAVLAKAPARLRLDPGLSGKDWRSAARQVRRALGRGEQESAADGKGRPTIRIVPPDKLAGAWGDLDGHRSFPDFPRESTARVLVGRSGPGEPPSLLVAARSPEALAALSRPLPHYGSYGWLAFRGAENAAKGRWPVPGHPLRRSLERPPDRKETHDGD